MRRGRAGRRPCGRQTTDQTDQTDTGKKAFKRTDEARASRDKNSGNLPHHPTDLIDKINLRKASPIAA